MINAKSAIAAVFGNRIEGGEVGSNPLENFVGQF
jgi:hypothetical protein